MQWITGNNASGKTLFVKKILDRYTAAGKSVITNNNYKLRKISEDELYESIPQF